MLQFGLYMTMSETYPNPEYESSRPETDPLDVILAMQFTHDIYDICKRDDKNAEDRRLDDPEAQKNLVSLSYVLFCAPKENLSPFPCNYNQIELLPSSEMGARKQVYEIKAMFPKYDDYQPFDLPEGTSRWNDVVLDLNFTDFLVGRYLLNSKGIWAFKDADDIDFDLDRLPESADLFTVKDESIDRAAPVMSGIQLRALLKGARAVMQSANPDEQ